MVHRKVVLLWEVSIFPVSAYLYAAILLSHSRNTFLIVKYGEVSLCFFFRGYVFPSVFSPSPLCFTQKEEMFTSEKVSMEFLMLFITSSNISTSVFTLCQVENVSTTLVGSRFWFNYLLYEGYDESHIQD